MLSIFVNKKIEEQFWANADILILDTSKRSTIMGTKHKIRVALLYGGKSGEHEVSLLSARSVMNAMDTQQYDILPILINQAGEWSIDQESVLRLYGNKSNDAILTANLGAGQLTTNTMQAFPTLMSSDIDVIFPILHGPNGEDGTIQGLLQLANKAYVGAGVLASAVGMDKIMMKRLFAQAGLPQGDFVGYLRSDIKKHTERIVSEIEARLGYPCFVKPANLGSSVGISKAKNKDQLVEALLVACKYDRKVIVEQFMDAREIEIAILGNDEPITSVPGEIVTSHEFYDYTAKYTDGKSEMIIPADVDESTAQKMSMLAKQAFAAIDGAGLARIDFFVERTTGEIYINEINTMPGFTQYSMYPLLWQHTGISYSELIDRLISLALERYEESLRSEGVNS